MYRIIYFVGMLVRQFLLPNPFTPLGTMGELINLVSSAVLMPLSYFQVSLIYTSGSAPALGSILFTVMYAVNTGVIYLIMLLFPIQWLMITAAVLYLLGSCFLLERMGNRFF